MAFTIDQIANAAKATPNVQNEPYVQAYRHFVDFFQGRSVIDKQGLVIGAHFVYGWMPTMLALNEPEDQFQGILETLAYIKAGQTVSPEELTSLARAINNSSVGASKLLHFINPTEYPIWDSRVYWFWAGERPYQYRMNSAAYLAYRQNCKEISMDSRFVPIQNDINRKMGYEVTAMRAIEWIGYINR